jgi:hypothetical protein
LSLLFILCGTWILGVVNNIYPNIGLAYAFTVVNSLQVCPYLWVLRN